MLVSLGGKTDNIIASIHRIGERAALDEKVPIIFCVGELKSKTKTAIWMCGLLYKPAKEIIVPAIVRIRL